MIPTAPTYILGLDLGQSNDFTALIVADVSPLPTGKRRYDLRSIQRIPLNTRYPQIVANVGNIVAILRGPVEIKPPAPDLDEHGVTHMFPYKPPQATVSLVIDYTGVGHPVLDMFIAAQMDCPIYPVTITGGNQATRDQNGFYVPKRDLASVVQRVLQEGRLKMPTPNAATGANAMSKQLTDELVGFRVKINLRGHDSYGAGEDWRSAPHDDLVLATALACWYGESATEVRIT